MNSKSWVLGTATFGFNYGIANREKGLLQDDPSKMLEKASKLGIRSVDTSPSYPNAEQSIGNFNTHSQYFECYTKITIETDLTPENVMKSLSNSMDLLQVPRLAGIYFHRPADLLGLDQRLGRAILRELLESGKVEKVGVSVYQIEEIIEVLKKYPEINLLQVPENILDQRLLFSPDLKAINESGVEIHVRSVLLQGLLTMELVSLPERLRQAEPHLAQLDKIATSLNISRLSLCLSYLSKISWASKFLIGAVTCLQLEEIINHSPIDLETSKLPARMNNDLVDPRNWKL